MRSMSMRTTDVPTVRTACATNDGGVLAGLRNGGGVEDSNRRSGLCGLLAADDRSSPPGDAGCTCDGTGGASLGGAACGVGTPGFANGLNRCARGGLLLVLGGVVRRRDGGRPRCFERASTGTGVTNATAGMVGEEVVIDVRWIVESGRWSKRSDEV